MKTVWMTSLILTMSVPAFGQEGDGEQPQPGKEHEILKRTLGTRAGEMKMWLAPGAEPIVIPVKETNTLVHGGFWVESEFESGPYKGSGVTGYDPLKRKYVGTWISNMTPHLTVMEGDYDEKKHEFTMHFTDIDPATQKPVKMKSVTKYEPGKPEVFSMYRKAAKGDDWEVSFVVTYDGKAK